MMQQITGADLPLRYTRLRRHHWEHRYQVWLAGRAAGEVSRRAYAGRVYWLYQWGAPEAPYINHQGRTRNAAVRGRLAWILQDAAWLEAWCEGEAAQTGQLEMLG